MAKNKFLKTILGLSIGALAITATVSLIQKINKPGDEPSISVPAISDEPEVDTRKNLAVFDFSSSEQNQAITFDNIKDTFNSFGTKAIFGDPVSSSSDTAYKFNIRATTGINFSMSTNINMTMNDFTYNRIKIKAANLGLTSAHADSTGKTAYSGSPGTLTIGNLTDSVITLATNSNQYEPYVPVEEVFESEEAQSTLQLIGGQAGGYILSLELWTE